MSSLARFPLFVDAGLDPAHYDRRRTWENYAAGQIVVDFQNVSRDGAVRIGRRRERIARERGGPVVAKASVIETRLAEAFGDDA